MSRLPRPCLGCGVMIRSGSRCGKCHQSKRGSTVERGYGADWQRVSREVLKRDGYRCQIRLPGCSGRADTVDHIVPLAHGGERLDKSNLHAACRHCNSCKDGATRRLQ